MMVNRGSSGSAASCSGVGWLGMSRSSRGHDLGAQDFDHAGVDYLVDFENGGAVALVDPVVSGGTQAQPLAGDVVFGQLGFAAVVDAHVTVDQVEQPTGAVLKAFGLHPVFGQLCGPVLHITVVAGDVLELPAQGFDSGAAVQT